MKRTLSRRLFAIGLPLAMAALTITNARGADDVPGEWRTYNRSLQADRYAPLDQIRSSNVSMLKPVCVYDLNVDASFQTGPIVIGDTLYATTEREVVAIDAGSCALKWRVREADPPVGGRSGTGTNRGLAYLDGRVFRGMPEGDLIAYDAATGKKVWTRRIGDPAKGESVPAAPIAWNGLVFVGIAGGDAYGVKGRIHALDAATGAVVWATYTVPTDSPQAGNEKMQAQAKTTWGNDQGVPITGGGTWTSYSLDPEGGLLYVPVGNPAPDFAGRIRRGDNLYTNSLLVLDAKTGIYRKHYSLVPADVHDWDVASAPVLVTTKAGKRIVAAAPKDGVLYGYDLSTDKRIFATSVTTRENVEQPLSTTPTRFCPGMAGGTAWNGPAYSPDTNLLYTGAIDWCHTVTLDPSQLVKSPGQLWTGAAAANPLGLPDLNWAGWVTAVDADSGQVRWRFRTGAPVVSGITTTKGGLVFAGDLDKHAYALDAETGGVLWRADLPGAPGGGIITYLVGNQQRVAFAVGMTNRVMRTTPASAKIAVFGL